MIDPNHNDSMPLSLAVSPLGHIYIEHGDNTQHEQEFLPKDIAAKILASFITGSPAGLLYLGVSNFPEVLPPTFAFWQRFARLFITKVCRLSHATEKLTTINIAPPTAKELEEFILRAPFMVGSEYLNADILSSLWQQLGNELEIELKKFSGNLQSFLAKHNSNWNLVGRVCFHLAENKNDPRFPFAFLATYTTKLTANAQVQHIPLGRALQEYANNPSSLLALLLPVQKASLKSSFIKKLIDNKEIFHPIAWNIKDAYQFLKEIPLLEEAGLVVRVPNWWSAANPPRPRVSVSIGDDTKGTVGIDALLDFDLHVALQNGEHLSAQELEALLNSKDNLVKIKGQWVEVDREKLQEVLEHWHKVQKHVQEDGLSFAEGMRLLAGTPFGEIVDKTNKESIAEWSMVQAGDWLNKTLNDLRHPENASNDKNVEMLLTQHLQANLRHYQIAGVKWLWLLYCLNLGGCLADDMGLGKTIQILSLILLIKYTPRKAATAIPPHLLIVPASLLGNWQTEIMRFAPSIKFLVIHSSVQNINNFQEITQKDLADYDVIITTYGFMQRCKWRDKIKWDVIVLDEAQMIKNPNTKQTQAVKNLQGKVRFTLSGTPIENRIMDLWSLFDFMAPGLLGSNTTFSKYSKQDNFFPTVRKLVSPYILRRLKSDKSIIADLPDKTEIKTYCALSKDQIGLYQKAVIELAQQLELVEGINRRGLVLSFILRFKQICNHPAQYSGHGDYVENNSGKFIRLKEICEEIAAKQEKVLIFTQFREIIPALADFLERIFGREGLILHGATAVKKRAGLVQAFQHEQGPPFFILSLKAGGTGLNLTNAAHVIHFDRWWNPAVENQATDRAYRIGQKKNVLVHKFISRGTIEEKIDNLIESKKSLSNEILGSGKEIMLTELSNEELMQIVTLDLNRAIESD